MDLILSIRQMMAESKFFEAQCEVELQLSEVQSVSRIEFVELYLEALLAQKKSLPINYLIELIEHQIQNDIGKAIFWLEKVSTTEFKKNFRRLQIIKIQVSEKQGRLDELYAQISDFQIHLFEIHIPAVPEIISSLIEKYFKNDFHLKLQSLALCLLLSDYFRSEKLIKDLIFSCVENASPRGIKEKMTALRNILDASELGALEIYKNYCTFVINGLKEKKDYKRLAELVIYFDDFKFQVLVLELLSTFRLTQETDLYVEAIKDHPDYDFVYLDKYFNELKRYFFFRPELPEKSSSPQIKIDLKLEGKKQVEPFDSLKIEEESPEQEKLLYHVLKHQDYSPRELIEIAVSFLQSEFPKVALAASNFALEKIENNEEFLKASYLKLTSLLQIGDYRAALDVALEALGHSRRQDDILSFMYGQAEAYLKLGQKREAKQILKKIISIDANYRMAKERLEKLNEI